jgi:light-regulated signal transduction histidine kinase (bacteriophytochrome)
MHQVDAIRRVVRQKNGLIDGLLALTRLDRQEMARSTVFPTPMVTEIVSVMLQQVPDRTISVAVEEQPPCSAYVEMLRQVFATLIGNAVKFTRDTTDPRIEIGSVRDGTETTYFVRDTGVGAGSGSSPRPGRARRSSSPCRRRERGTLRIEGG